MMAMPWATPRIRSCSVTSKSLIYSEIKAPISSAGSLMFFSINRTASSLIDCLYSIIVFR
nr:MAG TPA: hypothetical protein [Caudoviricetes sp.]